MNVRTYLRSRADASWLVAALAVGDLVAIAAFVSLGMSHHGFSPVEWPGRFLENVLPFLLGWVIASVVGGLYTLDSVGWPMRALAWTTPAWIVAALVGQAVRSTSYVRGDTSLTFLLVSLAFGGVLVIGWRVLVATLRTYRREKRSSA